MRQAAIVDHNRIGVPEIDSRQITRQHMLRFNVVRTPPGKVWTLGGVVEQSVEPRIRVMAAVCALGRKARGGKDKRENVRLFVAADPTQ